MGNTIQQHRAAIGLYGAVKAAKGNPGESEEEEHSHCSDPDLQGRTPGMQIWKGPWKWHALTLCLMFVVMTPIPLSCLKTLLVIGGIEQNPGPTVSTEEQKEGLVKLIASCTNEDTIKVLGLYDPSKTKHQQIVALKTLHVPVLRSACTELKVQTVGLSKDKLVDIMHLRIQALLPDICMYCSDTYQVKPDEDPTISCYVCEQGVHDKCLTDKLDELGMNANIFSIPGIYWICEHCDSQYEKQSQIVTPEQREDTQPKQQVPEQVDRTKTKVPEQPNIQPEKQTNSRNLRSTSERKTRKPTVSVDISDHVHVINDNESDDGRDYDDELYDDDSEYEVPICIHYKNGKCRHGQSGHGCDYRHPRQCRKLLNHGTQSHLGCNKGKKCEYLHPNMCYNSLYKKACYNGQCKFRHVRGTWKKEPGDFHVLPRFDPNTGQMTQPRTEPQPNIQNQRGSNDFLEILRVLQLDMQRMSIQMQNITKHQNLAPNPLINQNQNQILQPNSWANHAYQNAQTNPPPATTTIAWPQPQHC